VWKVGQNRWTIQEEDNYSKWIETNITEDFFIRHEIRVDCADVPYAARWIYSRINHLPAAARTADNRFIGHWSKDWARLPTNATWDKDRRFRAALMAMLSSTSTRTLPFDTYPIQIAADSVTAGTTFLITGDHAGIVSHIFMDGSTAHPIQTLEANLPTRESEGSGLRLTHINSSSADVAIAITKMNQEDTNPLHLKVDDGLCMVCRFVIYKKGSIVFSSGTRSKSVIFLVIRGMLAKVLSMQ
jgi:hypothetical protein